MPRTYKPVLTDLDMSVRILRIPEVMFVTGYRSRQQIYNLVKQGELPQPIKLRKGGRASGWPASVIHDYVRNLEVDPLAIPVEIKKR